MMRVITRKKNSHVDYVNVAKTEELTVNSGKKCDERDLPCGQKSR